MIEYGDVNHIVSLPGNRALVLAAREYIYGGEIGVTPAPGAVKVPGQARLYDASGQLVWSIDSVPGGSHVVFTDPLLLRHIDGVGAEYRLLDAASGRTIALRNVKAAHRVAFSGDRRLMVVVERVDSIHANLSVLELAKDSVRWARRITARTLPMLYVAGGSVILAGDRLDVVSASDGSGVGPGVEFAASDVIAISDGILALSEHGDVASIKHDGTLRWRSPSASTVRLDAYGVDSTRVIVVSSTGGRATRAVAVRLSDGGMEWERQFTGVTSSNVLRWDSLALVSTAVGDSVTVHAVSARKGASVFDAVLPVWPRKALDDSVLITEGRSNRYALNRLPCPELRQVDANVAMDRLTISGGRLVIVQEAAVGALGRNGDRLWWHTVPNPEATTACARYNTLNDIGFLKQQGGGRGNTASQAWIKGLEAGSASLAASNRMLSLQQSAQYDQRRSEGVATPAETHAEILNLTMRHQADAMNASIGLYMATQAALQNNIMRNLFPERMRRVNRLNDVATMSLIDAMQSESLYVRAFSRGTRTGKGKVSWVTCWTLTQGIQRSCDGYEGRSGVLVVNLHDGSWTELTTGPWESGGDAQSLGLQFPTVIGTSGRLAVAAPGLDTSVWSNGPRIRSRLKVAPQSMLAYEVTSLRLQPPTEYAARRTHLRGSPSPLSDHVKEIEANGATAEQLSRWFGSQVDTVSGIWESLYEVAGVVHFERWRCAMQQQRTKSCTLVPIPK